MFVTAQSAMRTRRMIESPSCAVRVMQMPDLGRLGRLTGPPVVTLGQATTLVNGLPVDLSSITGSSSSSGPFGMSWWTIGLIGAVLLGGALWFRNRGGGAGGMLAPVRRRRTKKISAVRAALYAAGAGAGGYLLGKSLA